MNLKPIENARDLSYQEIQAYGSSLCIVATAELQEKQLYIGIPVSK